MTNKFKEYNLNLDEKSKDLVNKYLEKIKDYVEKNSIEEEVYSDIEEMVFEKLSNIKVQNQLNVNKVLKEVGEPEIIFSDYVTNIKNQENTNKEKTKSKKPENKNTFYDNLSQNGWERDNEKAIILGICALIAEKSNIPVLFIRMIFVIVVIIYGSGVLIYLILGLIFPIKGVDYKGIGTSYFSYIKKQLRLLILDMCKNIIKLIKLTMKNLYTIIMKVIKIIIPVLRFCFFSFLGILSTIGFFALIIIGAAYFSSTSIENIDFISVLPNYFLWLIIAGIVSSSILAIFFFMYGFSGKILNKYIIGTGIASFIVALFLGASTIFSLVNTYSQQNIATKEVQVNLNDLKDKKIFLDINSITDDVNSWIDIDIFGMDSITLKESEDNNLMIKVNYNIRGNSKMLSEITESLEDISYEIVNNQIIFSQGNILKSKIPYSFINRDITLYIPEGLSIEFINHYPYMYYITNAHLSNEYEKYNNVNSSCYNKEIFYSQKEESFICSLTEKELVDLKKLYSIKYIIDNFNEISSIKHKDEYKRDYWDNNYTNDMHDWQFGNFYWAEDGKLNIEFRDTSLDIRASVDIIETENGIEVSNFKINNVKVEVYFKTKYYENIDSIRPFLSNTHDEEFVERNEF